MYVRCAAGVQTHSSSLAPPLCEIDIRPRKGQRDCLSPRQSGPKSGGKKSRWTLHVYCRSRSELPARSSVRPRPSVRPAYDAACETARSWAGEWRGECRREAKKNGRLKSFAAASASAGAATGGRAGRREAACPVSMLVPERESETPMACKFPWRRLRWSPVVRASKVERGRRRSCVSIQRLPPTAISSMCSVLR